MAETLSPVPFNLKAVVNFIETHGFHVESAEELPVEDPGVLESLDGPPVRAVRLTITPANRQENPEKGGKTRKSRKPAP
jgi:hypothetical protein